jgi:nucleotide-binding universal stress UspA family protein
VVAIASAMNARITLMHVLERSQSKIGNIPIDPVGWHMQKQESQSYMEKSAQRLQEAGLGTTYTIVEGNAAESIIEYARNNEVDLIVLCTHGRTGLSGWNVSSVVQKILLRSYKSILLVRAYASDSGAESGYKRVFIGTDCSTRAEYVLPTAIHLAQFYGSELIFGTVVQKPTTAKRLPLSEKEIKLINQLTEKNQTAATRYHEQLVTQFSLKGLTVTTNLTVAENVIGAFYDMVEDARPDLVMLVAHGQTGERRWAYGSITTSMIAYGSTPLLIMQDLTENDVPLTHAERAIREGKGH